MVVTTNSITPTKSQKNVLLDALYQKAGETKHYLQAYPEGEATALDTCCAAHLARFNDQVRSRNSLRERAEDVQALIKLVEAITPKKQT